MPQRWRTDDHHDVEMSSCPKGSRLRPRGHDNDGFRDIGRNIRGAYNDHMGVAGKHVQGLNGEQYIVIAFEIIWMIIFLVMTCINFADRITGMGEDAKYTMRTGPDANTKEFTSASSWYAFYLTAAIFQAVFLIGIVIYHFMYRSEDSTQPTWEVHTRHYITSLCGSLLFRILVCGMLASLIEQVRYDSVQALTGVNMAVTRTFSLKDTPLSGGLTAEQAIGYILQKLGTNAAYGSDLVEMITGAASEAAKKSAIAQVATHSVVPMIRASFTAVQDMALVLFLVMIPRAVTVLGKVVHDEDDATYSMAEKVVGETVGDTAMQ